MSDIFLMCGVYQHNACGALQGELSVWYKPEIELTMHPYIMCLWLDSEPSIFLHD